MVHYKNWLCFGLLITGLWLLRIVLTGQNRLGYIVWNAALAAVPLLLLPGFGWLRRRLSGGWLLVGQIGLASLWLLFLPNAFYLLTDLMHLNAAVVVNVRHDNFNYIPTYERGDATYIYDSLVLFLAAGFGAYVGGMALSRAYNWLHRQVGLNWAAVGLAGMMLLCGIGVYLGRFGRWNSWDALIHPSGLVTDLFSLISQPMLRHRLLMVVFTMLVFQLICFWLVRIIDKPKAQQ